MYKQERTLDLHVTTMPTYQRFTHEREALIEENKHYQNLWLLSDSDLYGGDYY